MCVAGRKSSVALLLYVNMHLSVINNLFSKLIFELLFKSKHLPAAVTWLSLTFVNMV